MKIKDKRNIICGNLLIKDVPIYFNDDGEFFYSGKVMSKVSDLIREHGTKKEKEIKFK